MFIYLCACLLFAHVALSKSIHLCVCLSIFCACESITSASTYPKSLVAVIPSYTSSPSLHHLSPYPSTFFVTKSQTLSPKSLTLKPHKV